VTFAILLIALGGFVLYFWAIGLRYLWFIPLVFLLLFLGYYWTSVANRLKYWQWRQRYLVFLAWIVILTGLGWSLHFFGISYLDISQILIIFNLIFWIGAYFVEYKDGEYVFQMWYYMSILWLLISSYKLSSGLELWKIFSIVWAMNTAVIWFIIFVVWIKSKIDRYMRYKLSIATIWSIMIIILDQVKDFYIALFLNSILLTGIYYLIYKIIKNRPPSDKQQKTISVRRILAWERITKYQKPFKQEFHRQVYDMIINMPKIVKHTLEWLNIILILVMIIIYIKNIWKDIPNMHERLYRIIIASFVFNVVLLKKVNYSSIIQRLIVFAVINFAIYVSLFSLYDGNISQIVWTALLWNIFCAIVIFYLPKIWIWKYFKKIDYIFWIITTIMAMVLNIVLFHRTDMPGQLLFSIVFLYVGIQAFTLFYASKHISKMWE